MCICRYFAMHPLCFCSTEYIKVLLHLRVLVYLLSNTCLYGKHFLFAICRVMIIDLDAHQGNGHEMDFANDSMLQNFYLPVMNL